MSTVDFLYKHIFRGWQILVVAAIATFVYLALGCGGPVNPVREARRKQAEKLAFEQQTKDASKQMRDFQWGIRPIPRSNH